jgi:O-succinylbenzoic acid--CoA ligase
LVALVRLQGAADGPSVLAALARLARQLPPAERPGRWLLCHTLEPTATGKWQRQRWQQWLDDRR